MPTRQGMRYRYVLGAMYRLQMTMTVRLAGLPQEAELLPKIVEARMATRQGIRYRYLLGAMQQLQITMTVRLMGLPQEAERLPKIVEAWRAASARMQQLLDTEAGAADRATLEGPPPAVRARLS